MMEDKRTLLNLCIIDACRDNPFPRGTRALAGGLAQTKAPAGSLLAYATAPGNTASDGAGDHGMYTEHLAKAILQQGKVLELLFKDVRVGVRQATSDAQTPWEESSLIVDFSFFTETHPPPSLDAVLHAAAAEMHERTNAAQEAQRLQNEIDRLTAQLDGIDDEESDESKELRRRRKQLRGEMASLMTRVK